MFLNLLGSSVIRGARTVSHGPVFDFALEQKKQQMLLSEYFFFGHL